MNNQHFLVILGSALMAVNVFIDGQKLFAAFCAAVCWYAINNYLESIRAAAKEWM